MKKYLLILCLAFVGCAESSDDKAPVSTVEGVDYSGTWRLVNVQCYNSNITTQTNVATISNGYTETVVITGNSYALTIAAPGCSVTGTGRLVASASTISLSSRAVLSATSGSCSASFALNGTAVTPNPYNSTYTSGQSLANATNLPYLYNSSNNVLGLPSAFADGVGAYCFVVYQKQ